MTDTYASTSDHDQEPINLRLDRGLNSRLTIVLGSDADERHNALTGWLDQRRFQVLLVECSAGADNPACPRLILDAFVDGGIVEELPGDHSSEEACKTRLVTLINALAALPRDLVVVLLNYQQRKTTNEMLSFMLEHLPQQVHIYLCCDDTPDLNCIPRLRVRRQFQTVETCRE